MNKMINISEIFEQLRETHDLDSVNSTSEGLKYIIDKRFLSEFARIIASKTLALAAQEAKCVVVLERGCCDEDDTFPSIVDRNSITNLILNVKY